MSTDLEKAIENTKGTMELEGFEVSDEVVEFLMTEPGQKEINEFIESLRQKYRKTKKGKVGDQ